MEIVDELIRLDLSTAVDYENILIASYQEHVKTKLKTLFIQPILPIW